MEVGVAVEVVVSSRVVVRGCGVCSAVVVVVVGSVLVVRSFCEGGGEEDVGVVVVLGE